MTDGDEPPALEKTSSSHLFISHDSVSKAGFRRIVSHARRTQHGRKQRQQRETAKQSAVYARSLVGWRRAECSTAIITVHSSTRVEIQTTDHGVPSDTDEVENQARQILMDCSIMTPADTGLRTDPFSSFPTDNDRSAMEMVDFYIKVWSIYKRGSIDVSLGLNTQIDMYWPVALQDSMLFDATLAVSRTAYCLRYKNNPDLDEYVLKHKTKALAKLRFGLQSMSLVPSEAIIYTVSRMLAISYMTQENEAFEAHFSAFQTIAQRYALYRSAEDNVARVMEARLKAWTPLFEYRQARNTLIPPLRPLAQDNIHPTQLTGSRFDELYDTILSLPSGFSQLAADGALSVEVIRILSIIQSLIIDFEDTVATDDVLAMQSEQLLTLREQLVALLASLKLSKFETQLCIALLALTSSLSTRYVVRNSGTSSNIRAGQSSFTCHVPLETIAKAFLYLQFAGAGQSPTHNGCLQWAALVLGCCCFLVDEPKGHERQKGHIALVSITERLLPPSEEDEWDHLAVGLQGRFFWPSILVGNWKRIYLSALYRQREWEGLGLYSIGVPSNDKIEYMVLR